MVTLIKQLEDKIVEIEKSISDISEEMELLDPECKDFETLDFELNYTNGMLIGYRHSLTMVTQAGLRKLGRWDLVEQS